MRDRRGSLLQASLVRLVRRGAWAPAGRLLEKSHPADIAAVLDRLTASDRKAVFGLIQPVQMRADVLSLLEFAARSDLLSEIDAEAAGAILEKMSADDAALILRDLSRAQADRILAAMRDGAEDVESLLGYDDDTAGAIMSPEFIALQADLTVKEAIEALQQQADAEVAFYVYVVDDQNCLVGVLSLRQLLLQPPYTQLRKCMTAEPIRVRTDTDQEEVAQVVARYDLLAAPVVDSMNHLVGVVTVDDVIDVMRDEATEDILKMAGTTVEEVTSPGVMRGAWIRFPWLAASFIGGLAGVFVLDRFEGVLRLAVPLAFFMPIILGMGGNVASQCAMIMVRGLATGRLDLSSITRVLAHEVGTALLLGVVFGAGLGGAAFIIGYEPVAFPLVVAVGIFTSILIAATLGTLLPLLFHRAGFDPAVASGPFVTTSSDVAAIIGFFIVATLLL